MKLFPYSLIRSAGLSFEDFNKSLKERDDLAILTSSYIEKKSFINLKKLELIRALQQLINSEKNNNHRKKIKKIKKNIQIDAELIVNDFFTLIDNNINGLLNNYKKELEIKRKDMNKIEEIYMSVLAHERANLVEIFKKNELKNGLLLSSQILLQNLTKYDSNQVIPNKKFNQLEWSMYKYASRASTKTSPFSSFTNVGISSFNGTSTKGAISGKLATSRSIVKFNSQILRHFIICLKTNKQYRSHFLLRPNPSITVKQGHYHFLINKQNIEAFQRLKKNVVLDVIFEILIEQLPFEVLLKKLIDCIDDSDDNIEFYLLELINNGFIEMHLDFSELDEHWEQKLITFLTPIKNSGTLLDKLRELYSFKNQYEKSNCVEERSSWLSKIQRTYEGIIELLVSTSDYKIKENLNNFILFYLRNKEFDLAPDFSFKKIGSQNIIYEDVLTLVDIEIPNNYINSIVEKLYQLFDSTKLYINNSNDYFDLINFFKANYNEEFVDLLTFYEDYFKEKQKEESLSDPNISSEHSTKIPEQLKEILLLRKSWEAHFYPELAKKYNPQKSEFHFRIGAVKHANSNLRLSDNISKNPFSSFIQLFTDDSNAGSGHLMAVCSSALNGYGKLHSRFLSGFPDEILYELKKWNKEMIPSDSIFAENVDSSVFNANHHPAIMDYEIQIPGVQSLLPQSNTIPLKDLHVKFNSGQEKLELYNKRTGKRVYVFDLCIQVIKGRSKLYQLLEIFSKVEVVSTSYLSNFYKKIHIQDSNQNEYKINHYPRVVFENTIVIRRASWVIPKECIAIRSEESDCNEFLIYNQWRKSLKIPDEVFVRIATRPKSGDTNRAIKEKFKRDNYKPQYINFSSPISVRYFGKLVKKAEVNFTIEEMLPNSSQLIKLNGKLSATEFLIQWK
ncbi:MAG: lantibiotic dehydratase [Bacteroidia bacterium]